MDALCLNQHDIPERSHLVANMSGIYRNATCVLIWLGNSDGDSDYTLELFNSTYVGSVESDLLDTRGARALLALFQRSYWRRLWIIQEVICARNLEIYCGTLCVSREFLKDFADIIPTAELLVEHNQYERASQSLQGAGNCHVRLPIYHYTILQSWRQSG